MTPLPPAWGDYSEWVEEVVNERVTYLRVTAFSSEASARRYADLSDRDFKRCDYPRGEPLCHKSK